MPDLADGESVEVQGSGSKPYVLKNTGGVYACTCPAWRNQSVGIERRTCKHLRKLRGDAAEEARLGGALPAKPVKAAADGEEVAGPPVLLAESWDNAQNLAGWWMSEKLDGVRAYWDGKQFLSRQGNLYHAPDWFTQGLPDTPLDGELWIGRKQFQRTVSIVRRQDKNELWKEVRFLVFDAPGRAEPFEDRLQFLKASFPGWQNSYTEVLAHAACHDTEHLRAELKRIETLGGEGLMLRQPGSKYVAGRSSTLLKVKSFLDAEAVVTGHEPGKGKHAGRLGAVTVKLPNGKAFSVGTGFSDHERANPPPIGTTITFRYQELSDGGIPRFPSFLRVRTDTAPVIVVAPPTGGPRRFEVDEKFWEVALVGTTVTTRWGKIGTAGQEKAKEFASEEKARKEYDKLIVEKTGKGYAPVS
ncbi:DNA ligase [Limnoglobus roseus]|uniref:DNA ligase n=1 Tax=Limnoglobus roseus TaxID=2598579 RepID=A0A5C1AEV7_9BACT|nr:DNA ligase [Limnoglobus roseus]QEL15654.1 DNA ligase [Limnoglobus roseus]